MRFVVLESATLNRMIDGRLQKIRSNNETEQIETAGYKDEIGDDERDLIESDHNT